MLNQHEQQKHENPQFVIKHSLKSFGFYSENKSKSKIFMISQTFIHVQASAALFEMYPLSKSCASRSRAWRNIGSLSSTTPRARRILDCSCMPVCLCSHANHYDPLSVQSAKSASLLCLMQGLLASPNYLSPSPIFAKGLAPARHVSGRALRCDSMCAEVLRKLDSASFLQ